jgi:hypothetical protein
VSWTQSWPSSGRATRSWCSTSTGWVALPATS